MFTSKHPTGCLDVPPLKKAANHLIPAIHSGFNGLGRSYRENSFRARHSHIQIVKERVELPSPKKRINVF
jgi:hypothetical protein